MLIETDDEAHEIPFTDGAPNAINHAESSLSRSRKRGRREVEDKLEILNQRVGDLLTMVQQLKDRQEAHWAQHHARQEDNLAQYNAQNNAHWARHNAQMESHWNTYLDQIMNEQLAWEAFEDDWNEKWEAQYMFQNQVVKSWKDDYMFQNQISNSLCWSRRRYQYGICGINLVIFVVCFDI